MRRETCVVEILGAKLTNVQVRIFFQTIFERQPSLSMAFSLHLAVHAEADDDLPELDRRNIEGGSQRAEGCEQG